MKEITNSLVGIEVKIAPDYLSAYVMLSKPTEGEELAATIDAKTLKARMKEALDYHDITAGILEIAMDELCQNPVFEQECLIAEGYAPVDGIDGQMEFFFNTQVSKIPVELEDGSVDFYHLNTPSSVLEGQVLCQKTSPIPGRAGISVLNAMIPCYGGREAELPVGKNTIASADGSQLLSRINGQVEMIDGKVVAENVLEISGDADISVGYIDFPGRVLIKGNVQEGMRIQADGNIDIWGVVESAEIVGGGDITVRGGINAMAKETTIKCDGNLNCRYIENAIIFVTGNIMTQAILNSQVKCGKSITALGRASAIIGGSSVAKDSITAKNLGSSAFPTTCVEVGEDMTLPLKLEVLSLEKEHLSKEIDNLQSVVATLRQLVLMRQMTPKKELALKNAEVILPNHIQRVREIEMESKKVKGKVIKSKAGKVIVKDKIYPGVRVKIGSIATVVKTELSGRTLVNKDGDIVAVK